MNLTIVLSVLGVAAVFGLGLYGYRAWKSNKLLKMGVNVVDGAARSDEREKMAAAQQAGLDAAHAAANSAEAKAQGMSLDEVLTSLSKPTRRDEGVASVWLLALIAVLTLIACTQQPVRRVVVQSFCEVAQPINPPAALIAEWRQDMAHGHLKAEEIGIFAAQLEAHNGTGRRLCGWTQ